MSCRFVSMLLLIVVCGHGCVDSETEADARQSCDLAVTCIGSVDDTIYVRIESGKYSEFLGCIGSAPNGRKGGKVVGFCPIIIGNEVIIKWGVEGKDNLEMKNTCSIDTRKYLPVRKKIRAIELMYSGNCEWTFKAYNSGWADRTKKELLPSEDK